MTQDQTSTSDIPAKETVAQCPQGGSSLSSYSHEALAERAKNGSVACFGELVERFEGKLLGYLRRRVGATDAEDLAQETFVRAWSSLGRYDPERSFSTWLFTIASRLATDHYRASSRDRKLRERRTNDGPEARSIQNTGEAASHGSSEVIWDTARRILNEEQLAALWLRYAGEMRITDVAKAIGKTQVATRVMLFRAREKLAAELSGDETLGVSRTKTLQGAKADASPTMHSAVVTPGGVS